MILCIAHSESDVLVTFIHFLASVVFTQCILCGDFSAENVIFLSVVLSEMQDKEKCLPLVLVAFAVYGSRSNVTQIMIRAKIKSEAKLTASVLK